MNKQANPATPKNPRSDQIKRTRPRGEFAHTYSVGRFNRGLETSAYRVSSVSNRTGEHITTYHRTEDQALAAAEGREAHHHSIRVVYDPESAALAAHKLEKAKAQAEKASALGAKFDLLETIAEAVAA